MEQKNECVAGEQKVIAENGARTEPNSPAPENHFDDDLEQWIFASST